MQLEKNIKLYYAASSLGWVRFYLPVFALFYIASQVTIPELSIILAVFFASIILLEVPTGIIADLLGRKKAMMISRCCYIAELIIITFFNGFTAFLIAKMISAVGVSLSSGSGEALFYDTFKAMGKESEFKKHNANLHMITSISMAVVMILGSIIFAIDPKLPALASIPFAIAGLIIVSMLKEPIAAPKNLSIKNAYAQLQEGLRYTFNHRHLKYLILFSFPIAALIEVALGFSSLHHQQVKVPIAAIGTIAMIASLLTAYAAKKSHKTERDYGPKKVLNAMQYAMLISFGMMAFLIPYVSIIFFLIIPIVLGFSKVLIQDYTNLHTESSHRATILSIRNLFDSLAIAAAYLIFGHFAKISLQKAYLAMFVIYAIFVIITKQYEKKKLN